MKKIFLFILALILSFITFLNLFAMHESSKVMTDSSPVSVDSRSPMPSEPSSIATGTTSSVDVKDDMSVTVTPDASLSKDVENGVTPGIATEKPMVPSRCGVNNQDVDCAQLEGAVVSVAKSGLWIMLLFIVLGLIGGIFWLVMLIHAISKPIQNKVLWILIIFFLNLLGAIIYYFVIKRNYIPTTIPSGTDPINSLNMGVASAPVASAPVASAPVAPAPAPAPVAPAPAPAPAPVAPGTTVNPPLA